MIVEPPEKMMIDEEVPVVAQIDEVSAQPDVEEVPVVAQPDEVLAQPDEVLAQPDVEEMAAAHPEAQEELEAGASEAQLDLVIPEGSNNVGVADTQQENFTADV